MSRLAEKSRTEDSPSAKAYRFDARLTEDQKAILQKAADLEGRTLTDFVLRSAEAAAERTLQERAMLVLTARETETFVESILRPAKPGRVLRAAARRYQKVTKG